MMEPLPLDTSHPAVREYFALVRLQVLTPLSLLLNIASVATCAFVADPSLVKVSKLYPTAISPSSAILGAYIAAIYVGQIGYCLLLVLTKREETKSAYVKAVGLFLPAANILMAIWAISWIMRWFLASTILLGLILLLLLISNVALFVYHPPEDSSALALAFVHAPMRFFFVLPFSILFALSLFITLGLSYVPVGPGEPPRDYSSWHALAGFGVILGTNLVSLVVIMARTDFVWCAAATWIAVAVWSAQPKPVAIYITALVFTGLHPLGFITSLVWARCTGRNTRGPRAIVLPGEDDAHPGLYGSTRNANSSNQTNGAAGQTERGPREVTEETWG